MKSYSGAGAKVGEGWDNGAIGCERRESLRVTRGACLPGRFAQDIVQVVFIGAHSFRIPLLGGKADSVEGVRIILIAIAQVLQYKY